MECMKKGLPCFSARICKEKHIGTKDPIAGTVRKRGWVFMLYLEYRTGYGTVNYFSEKLVDSKGAAKD